MVLMVMGWPRGQARARSVIRRLGAARTGHAARQPLVSQADPYHRDRALGSKGSADDGAVRGAVRSSRTRSQATRSIDIGALAGLTWSSLSPIFEPRRRP